MLQREKRNIVDTVLKTNCYFNIVHGILHCCGFDDHDEESHQKMHAEEDRILNAIGVGTVWSSDT